MVSIESRKISMKIAIRGTGSHRDLCACYRGGGGSRVV